MDEKPAQSPSGVIAFRPSAQARPLRIGERGEVVAAHPPKSETRILLSVPEEKLRESITRRLEEEGYSVTVHAQPYELAEIRATLDAAKSEGAPFKLIIAQDTAHPHQYSLPVESAVFGRNIRNLPLVVITDKTARFKESLDAAKKDGRSPGNVAVMETAAFAEDAQLQALGAKVEALLQSPSRQWTR